MATAVSSGVNGGTVYIIKHDVAQNSYTTSTLHLDTFGFGRAVAISQDQLVLAVADRAVQNIPASSNRIHFYRRSSPADDFVEAESESLELDDASLYTLKLASALWKYACDWKKWWLQPWYENI